MATFLAYGIDVINNPAIGTTSGQGNEGQGILQLQGGTQVFPDAAVIEFTTQNETPEGELNGRSSFIGIRVYASRADFDAGRVQHSYFPQNPGQSANIQPDLSGLGDTYVRFNANVLVARLPNGLTDTAAPQFGTLFVAPGSDAGANIGALVLDRNTDVDFNGSGSIDAGTVEEGNTLFFAGPLDPVMICFARGTRIATPGGDVAVDALRPGDRVISRDNGAVVLRWAGAKRAIGMAAPIRIRKGALGHGMPGRDLIVSPNHRVLMQGAENRMLFADGEVLVAARHLVGRPGVVTTRMRSVDYVHLMFDRHEVILSDGAWTESYHPGDYSLRGMAGDARREILALFPELRVPGHAFATARPVLRRAEAKLLRA